MKICKTSDRLKYILLHRNMRQVDILRAAKPFCEKYGVKLAKNDLSQYVSGLVVPGQEKLSILGLALNVSESWLMGYDVPMDRSYEEEQPTEDNELSQRKKDLIEKIKKASEAQLDRFEQILALVENTTL